MGTNKDGVEALGIHRILDGVESVGAFLLDVMVGKVNVSAVEAQQTAIAALKNIISEAEQPTGDGEVIILPRPEDIDEAV
jgi:hypothetical protein